MAAKWTHVRLKMETKRRLDAEIRRLTTAYQEGRTDRAGGEDNPNPAFAGMSVDALITRLLDLDERKRQRATESRKRKRRPAAG